MSEQKSVGEKLLGDYDFISRSDRDLTDFLIKYFSSPLGFDDKEMIDILKNGQIIRIIKDGKVTSVSWNFYSTLEWNEIGLYYKPEHGSQITIFTHYQISEFSKFIKDNF